jgi:hypothetical protein
MEKNRLAINDGQCPGPGFADMSTCPFAKELKSFEENLNIRKYDSTLDKEKLCMLLYDLDHDDRFLKNLGSRWTEEQANLSTARCCGCHQALKTTRSGESNHMWVVVGIDGNPLVAVHERTVNGEPLKVWNMEWRASSF